jgi:allantoinase
MLLYANGVQVDEFPAVSSPDVALAMKTLKDAPTTMMFHAEMVPPAANSVGGAETPSESSPVPPGELTSYNTFLESRPPAFETCAVDEILALAHLAPKLSLHIVHLSATECIPLLKEARRNGVNITAETCFHYLGLASENIPDGDTRHKCCPPIRSQTNQDRLWAELTAEDSCIKTIVSDHSPCTPELKLLPSHLQLSSSDDDASNDAKSHIHHSDSGIDMTLPKDAAALVTGRGDFFAAWGGISSVGLGLPILWTTAAMRAAEGKQEGVPSIVDVVRMCCQATAKQVGLSHRKGGLRVGLDADVCVFDDADCWTLQTGDMRWKNRCSPWEGHAFTGRVHETWLRGKKVFELGGTNDGFISGKPTGQPIVEKRTV